jgi:valyl-tRNA synthetase
MLPLDVLPKRYVPKDIEPKWQAFWETQQIYRFDPQSHKPTFSIDTPPPYVSAAHLHVGHAMSYSQAEFVVRFFRMRGYNVFYPMGFDDNGLPTEKFVESKYKINKAKIERKKFVELCLEETARGRETYEQLWRAMGLSIYWSLTYSTINPACQRVSQLSFLDLYSKGLVERKNDPMIWCTKCQTAIAQAEIEPEDQNTTLNFIEFGEKDSGLIIATTRPELIPSCVAMYVNSKDPRYAHLLGEKIMVPVSNHEVSVLADDDVDVEFGTGLMMVCTWGDSEDVRRWRRDKLSTRNYLNKAGRFQNGGDPIEGMTTLEAREKILALLKEDGHLKKQEPLSHSVGTHDRCGSNIEFYMTPQWFIKVMDSGEAILARGRELKWYPAYYQAQFEDWVKNLRWDWCISRQRFYGVPFPVWYCNNCQTPVLAEKKNLPVDPLTDASPLTECPHCQGKSFSGETDVMDTWMTSSLTPLINCRWDGERTGYKDLYPMSVRVQAFEIIRTWLYYTVLKSHFHTDSLPWKAAMISGWGLDQHGKKISKSRGNYTPPQDIIDRYSADALRYWAASANLGANLNYNEGEVAQGVKLANKLWNACKFMHSHAVQNPNSIAVPMIPTNPTDFWILHKLNETLEKATVSFEQYDFSKARHVIDHFFWLDLCDNYLEIVKDRLYKPELYGLAEQSSARTAVAILLAHVIKLYAPFVPFVTEELYQGLVRREGSVEPISVHVADWPAVNLTWNDDRARKSGDLLVDVVKRVRRFKTENALALNTELSCLTLASTFPEIEALKTHQVDLRSATRAKEIQCSTDTGLTTDEFAIGVSIAVSKQD